LSLQTPSRLQNDQQTAPWLTINGRDLCSRVLVGIEQYSSIPLIQEVLEASDADVFITTVDPDGMRSSLLLSDLADAIPLEKYTWIGTTSFARSAEGALRTVEILRRTCDIEIIKLDVRDNDNRPDNEATIKVSEQLLADGLTVIPFIRPDSSDAARLQDIGCSAIRLMASPVASGRGITDPAAIRGIIESSGIPVIVEGGLGTAHHVSQAMELGADAVLVNTALAQAQRPGLMAAAMRHAAVAGRLAYQSRTLDPAA
jgi:thiazole synthase